MSRDDPPTVPMVAVDDMPDPPIYVVQQPRQRFFGPFYLGVVVGTAIWWAIHHFFGH